MDGDTPNTTSGVLMTLPRFYTPEEIGKHFGWSPRRIRSIARENGICSIVGNRMIMTEAHLEALLELAKPKPLMAPTRLPRIVPRPPRGRNAKRKLGK